MFDQTSCQLAAIRKHDLSITYLINLNYIYFYRNKKKEVDQKTFQDETKSKVCLSVFLTLLIITWKTQLHTKDKPCVVKS